jgi:hypothetical protein
LSIRFQADNDLKRIIVNATLRREPRIDFQTAQDARLDGLDDEAVMRLAGRTSWQLGRDLRRRASICYKLVACQRKGA